MHVAEPTRLDFVSLGLPAPAFAAGGVAIAAKEAEIKLGGNGEDASREDASAGGAADAMAHAAQVADAAADGDMIWECLCMF